MKPYEKAQAHLHRMDWVVKGAEIKWGLFTALEDKLGGELAAKFKRQWEALSAAVMAQDHDGVATLADGVIRGVWALEKAAFEMGLVPDPLPEIGAGVAPVVITPPSETIKPLPKDFWTGGGDKLEI